jgi:hypothetical protein
MKKNTSAEPKPVNESRRRFLTTVALGASAAPFLSLSRGLLAEPAAPADPGLCYSNKRVLGPSDFRYLGAMRVPATGADMSFSYGQLTGRRVGGAVRLLMVGNLIAGDPIHEFADAGSYDPDEAVAPRMSLVRSWGNVYGAARRTWRPDGSEKTGYPRYPGSLQWNEATQMLYWTYYDTYNTTGDEDWCLGASSLLDAGPVAFGPWRPSGGGKKGPWRSIRLALHPSGDMLCGSGVMAGSSNSPWGPDLWSGPFPNAGTPSGFGRPDLTVQKYLTYYPMVGHINGDGTYSGPIRSCRRPGDYVFEPIVSGGGAMTEIDPTKNGGVGSWTQLDSVNGMAWIDLPDAHGVIFTGRLASGHVWYSNAGLGNLNCTHGLPPPVATTGPVSTDAYPAFVLYDPADLNAVRAGSRVDYTVDPTSVVNTQTTFGTKTASITSVGSAKALGGCYFDTESRKLYIAAPQADATIPGLLNPLIHVFQVA